VGQFRPHVVSLVLLLALVVAVYGRVLTHGFLFNWDDAQYVMENEAIRGFSWQHLSTIFTTNYVGNYAPVQMLSYMLDYSVWGLSASGFLLSNILIHTLNGLLIYKLFLRFYGGRILAFFGASLFLLHPVQVESVAWI
jgi:hypothetical protein